MDIISGLETFNFHLFQLFLLLVHPLIQEVIQFSAITSFIPISFITKREAPACYGASSQGDMAKTIMEINKG